MRGSLFLALALYLTACGGPNVAVSEPESFAVTEDNVDDVEVRFLRSVNVEEQAALRGPLLAFYAERAGTTYEEMAETALLMGGLLAPSSLEAALPAELAGFGQSFHDEAARRGREGHAMAALTLLARALPDDREGFEAEMARIRTWGEEARSDLGSDFARTMSLIDVWEDVVDVAPTKEAVRILAELYVSAGRASVQLSDALGPEMMERRQVAHFAPFQGAGVFLRFGMFEEAIALLDSARDAAHRQLAGLIQADLGNIRSGNEAGARAVRQISEAFAEAMPEVTLGLCRYGLRAFASDSYFATCVAQHSQGRAGVRLRLLRDASSADEGFQRFAGEQAQEWIAQAVSEGNLSEARALTDLYSSFAQGENPRVLVAQTYSSLGMAHAERGELEPARENLERAVMEGVPGVMRSESLEVLARIDAGQGRFDSMLNHLRAALEGSADAAGVWVEIGIGEQSAGRASQAQEAWRRAIELASRENFSDRDLRARFRAHWYLGEHEVAIDLVREYQATPLVARLYVDLVTKPEVPVELVRQVKLAHDNSEIGSRVHAVYSDLLLWVHATLRHEEMPADVRERLHSHRGWSHSWTEKLANAAFGDIAFHDALEYANVGAEECELRFYLGIRMIAYQHNHPNDSRWPDAPTYMFECPRADWYGYTMAREVRDQLPAR